MPFPSEFPQKQLRDLLAALTGQSQLPKHDLIEAAYDVEGYALSQIFGAGYQPAMGGLPKNVDRQEVLKAAAFGAGSVNWQQILLIAMELLKQFLSAST